MSLNNSSKNTISPEASKPSRKAKGGSLTGGIPLTPSEKESLRADLKAGMTEERSEAIRKILREMGIEPKG